MLISLIDQVFNELALQRIFALIAFGHH